jgi:hypothetical protein
MGLARAFEAAIYGRPEEDAGEKGPSGFFRSLEGAPALGYRAPRAPGTVTFLRDRNRVGTTVLTGEYGARVLAPLVADLGGDIDVVVVRNEFFGGNIAVAGLMTGADLSSALARLPEGRRYLVPDSCLSGGKFLDGMALEDLPRPVEVVPADGASLRQALAPVAPMALAR